MLPALVRSVEILGGVGLVFAIFIALAYWKLRVWEDPRIDAVVRIPEGKTRGARDGEIVEVRLTAFPDARRVAHGVVEERIGFLGEPGVDIEIVLRSHGFPPRFPEPVVAASEKFPEEIQPAFESLERAYQARSAGLIYLHLDSGYEALRADPRYADILARIGVR